MSVNWAYGHTVVLAIDVGAVRSHIADATAVAYGLRTTGATIDMPLLSAPAAEVPSWADPTAYRSTSPMWSAGRLDWVTAVWYHGAASPYFGHPLADEQLWLRRAVAACRLGGGYFTPVPVTLTVYDIGVSLSVMIAFNKDRDAWVLRSAYLPTSFFARSGE